MLRKIETIIILILAVVAVVYISGYLSTSSKLKEKIKEYENQKEISEQLQTKLDETLKEKDEALESKDIRIAEIRAKELKTVENLSKSSKKLQETKEELIILKSEYSNTDKIVANLEAQVSLFEKRETLFTQRIEQKERVIFNLEEKLIIKDEIIETWKKKYQDQVNINQVADQLFEMSKSDIKLFKLQRNIGTTGGIIFGFITGVLIAK